MQNCLTHCKHKALGHLLTKLPRQLHTLYRFLSLLLIPNNLGHLLFARKLTPTAKTDRVLTHFCHSKTIYLPLRNHFDKNTREGGTHLGNTTNQSAVTRSASGRFAVDIKCGSQEC